MRNKVTYNFDTLYPTASTYNPSQSNRQSSTLDFFITNISETQSLPDVMNDLSSDHLPVLIMLRTNCNKSQIRYFGFNKSN